MAATYLPESPEAPPPRFATKRPSMDIFHGIVAEALPENWQSSLPLFDDSEFVQNTDDKYMNAIAEACSIHERLRELRFRTAILHRGFVEDQRPIQDEHNSRTAKQEQQEQQEQQKMGVTATSRPASSVSVHPVSFAPVSAAAPPVIASTPAPVSASAPMPPTLVAPRPLSAPTRGQFQEPPPVITRPCVKTPVAPPTPTATARVGAYSPRTRKARIQRYIEKRARRKYRKRGDRHTMPGLGYPVRQAFAQNRARIGGRFISKTAAHQLLRSNANNTVS